MSPTEGASSGFVRPEDPYAGADTTSSERPHLPVYDHRLDLYERYVVDRAVDTLVVECLVDLGHEASVAPETRMDPLAMSAFGPQRECRRYGNVRVDIAEEHGFGLPEDEGGDPYLLGEDADLRALAEAALRNGGPDIDTPSGDPVPEGGCLSWARKRIDPNFSPRSGPEDGTVNDVPGSHVLVEDLLDESFAAAMEDSRVVAATVAWEECMAGQVDGYPGSPTSGEGSSSRAAVPHVECKDSSGYLDTVVDVERDFLKGAMAEHEEVLTERRDELRKQVEVSLEVLGW